MGEQKRRNKLLKYYLGLDYTYADTKTINDAESFFTSEYNRDVYIIPPENKICSDFPTGWADKYTRNVLDREREFWTGDYEDDRAYDLSPYGDLYLSYLEEEFKTVYSLLVLKGQHLEKAEQINLLAKDKLFDLKQELLAQNPYPSKNPLENEKHLIMLEAMAKEIILHDYVFIPPEQARPNIQSSISDKPDIHFDLSDDIPF